MNRRRAILLFAAAPLAVFAQSNDTLSADDLFDMGQQFLEENVDDDVPAQLGTLDQEKVRAVLKQLQAEFDQDYVLDLAALKDAAQTGLRLLEANPDTQPYADWLRPRLDYFDAAGQMDRAIPAPRQEPENPAPRKPAPSAVLETSTWSKLLKNRSRPAGAQKFEPALKRIFARHGLPPQLFWLAEVESDFNPKARSPAGAVGLYQLMPQTAKSLGLTTWPLDERKNPEKSADAAARHLRTLYDQFHDWPLAVAAYNAGAGRVQDKLRQAKEKTFDAIAAKLPSETQLYVPKLNAVLQLREGTTLEKLAKPS